VPVLDVVFLGDWIRQSLVRLQDELGVELVVCRIRGLAYEINQSWQEISGLCLIWVISPRELEVSLFDFAACSCSRYPQDLEGVEGLHVLDLRDVSYQRTEYYPQNNQRHVPFIH